MIYTDITRAIFAKNRDDASEDEVASELAPELSSDERGLCRGGKSLGRGLHWLLQK